MRAARERRSSAPPPPPPRKDARIAGPLAIPDLPAPPFPDEGWADRLATGLASGVDAAVLRVMERAVDAFFRPAPGMLPELRASAGALLEPELVREPQRFFAFGDAPPAPAGERERARRALGGGVAVSRELTAPYRPFGLLGSDAPFEARLLCEHWMREEARPRGVVVALHGFMMGEPRVDARMLFARAWLARGLDVALLTLPHHGRRRPAGARFSGEPFATPHVGRMAEAVRQAVWEIRLLAAWLRRARSAPVGLLGLSLGGTLAALAAGLWDEFDFAVPMASPVCIGDLAWRFMTRSRSFRGAPREVSRRELRALFRAISPLAHPLRIPRERALVVGGRGDRIVPPEHPAALWRHWGEPPLHWFAGSHLAPIGRGGIVDAVERHLRGLGLL